MLLANIALVLGSYLLGSAPHLYGLAKLWRISVEDDLHITLWRKAGVFAGMLGILTDFAKGMIPVLVGRWLGFDEYVVALAGLAAVAGQMWPVFLRFDGERGNSTGLGMAITLTTWATLFALIPVVIGAAVRTLPRLLDSTRSVDERLKLGGPKSASLPLGMIIGFAVLPVASWGLGQPAEITLACLVLFVMIAVRRLTRELREDLTPGAGVGGILLARLLFDRHHR